MQERYKWRNREGKKPAVQSTEGLTDVFTELLRDLRQQQSGVPREERGTHKGHLLCGDRWEPGFLVVSAVQCVQMSNHIRCCTPETSIMSQTSVTKEIYKK